MSVLLILVRTVGVLKGISVSYWYALSNGYILVKERKGIWYEVTCYVRVIIVKMIRVGLHVVLFHDEHMGHRTTDGNGKGQDKVFRHKVLV